MGNHVSLLRRPQARTQAQGFTATSTHSKLKAKELGVRQILLVPRGPLAPPAQLEHPGLACGPRALDPRTPNASPLPVSPSHSIKHADLLGLAQAWQSERNTRHTIISVGGFGMLGQPELPGSTWTVDFGSVRGRLLLGLLSGMLGGEQGAFTEQLLCTGLYGRL